MIKTAANFCSHCGAKVSQRIPKGDNRLRDVCLQCGGIHYQNPCIVAGCLPVYGDEILLCKRAIEPRKGYWTLPGGFLELGETVEEGAVRETWEEACARVEVRSLYTMFDVIRAGQVSVFFLADLPVPDFSAGVESEDVRLFSEAEIPWGELAFSTITRTLYHYFQDRKAGVFSLHTEKVLPASRR